MVYAKAGLGLDQKRIKEITNGGPPPTNHELFDQLIAVRMQLTAIQEQQSVAVKERVALGERIDALPCPRREVEDTPCEHDAEP